MTKHYSKDYYEWQKKSGELGALIDLWKFEKYIKSTDAVLDFGCGGGYILEGLKCRKKVGIEVNEFAQKVAKERGIQIYSAITKLPKNAKFDAIISHHALEHVSDPAQILKILKTHLKKNGLAVHVVPINDWRNDKKYNPEDINKHLYTWTPLLLGNLFVNAGYRVKNIRILTHAWLPLSKYYYPYTPKFLYHIGCTFWSFITRNRQILIVSTI